MLSTLKNILNIHDLYLVVSYVKGISRLHLYTVDGSLINASTYTMQGDVLYCFDISNNTTLSKYEAVGPLPINNEQLDKVLQNGLESILLDYRDIRYVLSLSIEYLKLRKESPMNI